MLETSTVKDKTYSNTRYKTKTFGMKVYLNYAPIRKKKITYSGKKYTA